MHKNKKPVSNKKRQPNCMILLANALVQLYNKMHEWYENTDFYAVFP